MKSAIKNLNVGVEPRTTYVRRAMTGSMIYFVHFSSSNLVSVSLAVGSYQLLTAQLFLKHGLIGKFNRCVKYN